VGAVRLARGGEQKAHLAGRFAHAACGEEKPPEAARAPPMHAGPHR
jgi:hypothetical protein